MELYRLLGSLSTTASRFCGILSRLFSGLISSHTLKCSTRDSQHPHPRSIVWGDEPPLIVFILGPPGAGKETHSKRLRRDFAGLTHLSYGDMLRYQAAIPGSWVSTFPRRGGSVDGDPVLPAADAVRLLREAIEAGLARGQHMWLIDGFPRTKEHLGAWDDAQMPRARCAFFLRCDGAVLVERVFGRAAASGRPADADGDLVRERVQRNILASGEMLQACRDCDISVAEIDADRDLDSVYRDVSRYFEVSLLADRVARLKDDGN